jgi:hypothetical protein
MHYPESETVVARRIEAGRKGGAVVAYDRDGFGLGTAAAHSSATPLAWGMGVLHGFGHELVDDQPHGERPAAFASVSHRAAVAKADPQWETCRGYRSYQAGEADHGCRRIANRQSGGV